MNCIIETLIKIKEYAEEHKTAFDFSVGGSIGFFTSLAHYWNHFTMEENLFHFYDGILKTAGNTITGAILLWLIHKLLPKSKKYENKSRKV